MASQPTGACERVAIVDLGSNSFRMVVFDSRELGWGRIEERSAAVRIGAGLGQTGRLGEEAMQRGLDTLREFAVVCERHGLDQPQIDAVATSAIRDAENGEGFLRRVRAGTGLDVRVLSREQEARYGYLAAVHSTALTDGCVLDLGGGSLQLVRVAGRIARESGSWRLGAVRMTERFLAGDGPAKRSQRKALQAHVVRKLERAPWLASCGGHLVGLGGTVRNLACAAQRLASATDRRSIPGSGRTAGSANGRHAGLPADEVQGFTIDRDALGDLVERLAALSPARRGSVPGIKQARADIVLAGALTIQEAMRSGGFSALEVTGAGLREGIFFERRLLSQGVERVARAA